MLPFWCNSWQALWVLRPNPTTQHNCCFLYKKNASSFPNKYRFLFLSPIKNLLLPLFFLLHAIRAQIWSVLLLLFFLIKWWLIGVSIFFTGDDGYCGMVSLLLRRWFRTTGYVYSSPLFLILWFDLVFLDWFPESIGLFFLFFSGTIPWIVGFLLDFSKTFVSGFLL